ncbi:MAG: type II secretion system protein GspN [Deltaproteobacteria bacterium RBG_13_49_15]|nr:MAG: type II secretion system protein GspN [Deltaproteobacteria bacterium RBG_13_49_15]
MKRRNGWICYALFTSVMTALFLYYLFPSETIRQYIEFRLPQVKPNFSISINKMRPSFPIGVLALDTALKYSGNPFFSLTKIKLLPNLFSLFRKKTVYRIQASAYDGSINGIVDVGRESSKKTISASAILNGIAIGKMAGVIPTSGRNISGVLNGQLLYQYDAKEQEALTASLSAADFKADIDSPWFAIKSLTFKTIEADLKVQNQTLLIRQCVLKGPYVDGRISGSVFFNKEIGKSVLNLNGKAKPHHLLLAEMGKESISLLFPVQKSEQSIISFRISGTLNRPNFSLEPL